MTTALPQPRELTDRVRRYILLTNGVFLVAWFTGLAWLASFSYFLFGFNFFEFVHPHDDPEPTLYRCIYLMLAIGTPIATAIWSWLRIRHALYLAQYGIEVTAKVTSLGLRAQWRQNLEYEYMVGSEMINGKISQPVSVARGLQDGTTPFVILVNPRNHARFMMKSDVFPREGKWHWWKGYIADGGKSERG